MGEDPSLPLKVWITWYVCPCAGWTARTITSAPTARAKIVSHTSISGTHRQRFSHCDMILSFPHNQGLLMGGSRLPCASDEVAVGAVMARCEYLFSRPVDKVNLIEHYGLSHCNGCK